MLYPFYIIALLSLTIVYLLLILKKERIETQKKLLSLEDVFKKAKEASLKTQRVVVKGQISEQLVPLADNFPYKISDMKFFGNPVDYVIFNGLSENKVTEVVFAEIKTGSAKLTETQRQIKEAIEAGRVKWITLNFSPKALDNIPLTSKVLSV